MAYVSTQDESGQWTMRDNSTEVARQEAGPKPSTTGLPEGFDWGIQQVQGGSGDAAYAWQMGGPTKDKWLETAFERWFPTIVAAGAGGAIGFGGAAAGAEGATGADVAFSGGEGTFAGSGTSMPAAAFDTDAVAGMSRGAGGGMMPAAVPESGSTLGAFPSAAAVDPSGFGSDFDVSSFADPNFGAFANPDGGAIDPSGFGSSFDSPGMPMDSSGSSFDDWWKKIKGLPWRPAGAALNLGSGLYGLHQARQMRKIAEQAQDPNTPQYRAQLAALMADPSSVKNIPGYQFGMDEGRRAIERRGAATGSGGNEAIALARYTPEYAGKFYDMEARRLANLAQGNPSAMIQGNAAASKLSSQALASLGYGAFMMGSSKMPW